MRIRQSQIVHRVIHHEHANCRMNSPGKFGCHKDVDGERCSRLRTSVSTLSRFEECSRNWRTGRVSSTKLRTASVSTEM